MNLRIRKIISYRIVAAILLLLSISLSAFALYKIIIMKPEKIILDCITLGLTIAFPIAQIVLISSGKKKESHLIDIAFNNDNTINKFALVVVLVGTAIGIALDILGVVVLLTRVNTTAVICSMYIIIAISSYLLLNCLIYLFFAFIFRKKKLTLEDYAK